MSNILYTIFEQVKKKKEKGELIIELNVGEPDQNPPKKVIESIMQSLNKKRVKYCSAGGESALKKVIAEKHQINPANVIIGPGSKFLIYAFLKAILSKKDDEIIIPVPIWGTYASMINNIGLGKIKFLKTRLRDNWQINPERLKGLINKKTKLIVICNPNNPTSTTLGKEIKDEIIRIAGRNNIKVIMDEAYKGLIFRKQQKENNINLRNIIQIFSFSKGFAMTGFRLGYAIADKNLIKKIVKFNQITITCVPQFIQDAGITALKKESKFSRKLAVIYQQRVKIAGKILNNTGVEFVKPEAGFYIFAKLPKTNAEKFSLKLLSKHVAVVPGTAFGSFPNFIRIALTVTENKLRRGLEIIRHELQ